MASTSLALPGVFTGIDTETMVAKLMAIESQPLQHLQQRKTRIGARKTAFAEIQKRVQDLKDLLARLRSTENLQAVSAASSDTKIATVTASTGAAEGSHEVVVNQLARADRLVHTAGLASAETEVGAPKSTALNAHGTASADEAWFTASANGATYTFDFGTEADIDNVTFAADTSYSMNDVAALINARSQAVSGYDAASVEYDSQQGKYFLRLTAQGAGAVGALTATLVAGDSIAELNDEADWNKTDAGAGVFSYTYDGTTRTIYATADTTLADLRDLINHDGGNPGVTAGVLQYNGAYHLVLAGKDTGADHTITVNNYATTIGGFDAGDFTRTQEARDAEFRVDGYPPEGNWMEAESNAIADVIPGVTVNLQSAGTVDITLSRSTAQLKTNLGNLVAIYNGLAQKIDDYTAYDAKTKQGGILQSDGTVSYLLSQVRNTLTLQARGFLNGTDRFTVPAEIGLEIDKDGVLSLDESKLDAAIAANYEAVLALIGAQGTGASDSSFVQLNGAATTTTAGTYEVRVDFDAAGAITAARIRTMGAAQWNAADVDGNIITGRTGNPEAGLVLTAVWDTSKAGSPYTQEAKVRLQQGFAGRGYNVTDELLDPVSGSVVAAQNRYQSTIDQLGRSIETQQTRLDAKETQLRQQFARLEATLTQLDSFRGAYESLFTSLASLNGTNQQ